MSAFDAYATLAPAELPASLVAVQNAVLLRVATYPYGSAETRTVAGPGVYWPPRILSDVVMEQSAIDALTAGGVLALSVGEIDLADADDWSADLDRYDTAVGRDAVIRVVPVRNRQATDLGTHWLDVPVGWRGVVRAVRRTGGLRARISLADLTDRLNTPLQPTRYAGTGGAEGGAELAGRPKPVCLGQVFNVAPVFLGNVDLGVGALPTYQVHWRSIQAIDAVRIRGVAQVLNAGTPGLGEYRGFESQGLFQLGSSPDGEVRADVRGDNVGSFASTTGAVLDRLLRSLGAQYAATDLDSVAFTQAEIDLPGTVGFYQGPEPVAASAAVSAVCAGAGAVLAGGRTGLLRLFDPIATGTAQFGLPPEWVIEAEPVDLPASLRPLPTEIRVAWGRNWNPHTGLAGSVPAGVRQRLEGADEPVARVTASSTMARVALQRGLDVPGLYFGQADAQARANRLAAWVDAGPRAIRIVTDRYLGQVELGHVGTVTYPAFGLENGFTGVVMGWREAFGARRVEITLVGFG